MRWNELVADLEAELDNLSQQAERAELAELIVAERAQLRLEDRLRGQLGAVSVGLGDHTISGRVRDSGPGWVWIEPAGHDVLVALAAAQWFICPSRRAVPASETARALGLGHVLRAWLGRSALVTGRRGGAISGRIAEVGRDFVAISSGGAIRVVPFRALQTVSAAQMIGLGS